MLNSQCRSGVLDLDQPLPGERDSSTVLHKAVIAQRPQLVRALLRAGTNPNRATVTGESALHLAVRSCCPAQTALRSPVLQCKLCVAGSASSQEIVRLLLQAEADATLREARSSKTAFDLAATGSVAHIQPDPSLLRLQSSCVAGWNRWTLN